MAEKKELLEVSAKDRTVWRKWLAKNHTTTGACWLKIFKKGSATPSINYAEAVEEALCFGWIDSVANKRNEEYFVLYFTERKPKGVWSKLNKTRIERLIKAGLMTDAGLEKIRIAKENGAWSTLDEIEEDSMPDDLAKALKKNKKAFKHFNAFPPSARKAIYQWIISAKQTPTKEKHIKETVEKAALNIRANQWIKKS